MKRLLRRYEIEEFPSVKNDDRRIKTDLKLAQLETFHSNTMKSLVRLLHEEANSNSKESYQKHKNNCSKNDNFSLAFAQALTSYDADVFRASQMSDWEWLRVHQLKEKLTFQMSQLEGNRAPWSVPCMKIEIANQWIYDLYTMDNNLPRINLPSSITSISWENIIEFRSLKELFRSRNSCCILLRKDSFGKNLFESELNSKGRLAKSKKFVEASNRVFTFYFFPSNMMERPEFQTLFSRYFDSPLNVCIPALITYEPMPSIPYQKFTTDFVLDKALVTNALLSIEPTKESNFSSTSIKDISFIIDQSAYSPKVLYEQLFIDKFSKLKNGN